MRGENEKLLVRGEEVFIGVDVHKESWHVTARAEGEEVFHGGIPSQYHALGKPLDRFKDCKIKVAYEAGPCGFWLYDRLTEDRIEAVIAIARMLMIRVRRILLSREPYRVGSTKVIRQRFAIAKA